MAPRRRKRARQDQMVVGNTRMDAALDAMRPYGFDENLVRETVEELVEVYEGNWHFFEEDSYNVLLETLLSKISSSPQGKDNARGEGNTETSSATTPTTAITEAGSSNRVAQDTLLLTGDGLDSASQTNDVQDTTSLDNPETEHCLLLLQDGKDLIMPAETERRHEQGIGLQSGNKQNQLGNSIGSKDRVLSSTAKHLVSICAPPPIIQSSQRFENQPFRRRKPCHGWISDSDDDGELIHLPQPPIPKEPRKLLDQSATPRSDGRRRRKSRWDEKPDGL